MESFMKMSWMVFKLYSEQDIVTKDPVSNVEKA